MAVTVAVAVTTLDGAEVPGVVRVPALSWKSAHDSSRTVLPAELTVSDVDVTEYLIPSLVAV